MKPKQISNTLQQAIAHHRAGQLVEAEALYEKILKVQPKHADALHLLGVIAHQTGQHAVAVELITESIRINPGNAGSYNNLGNALRMEGRLKEAAESYRKGLKIAPNDYQSYSNLGNVLSEQSELKESIECYEKALKLKPDCYGTRNNLGHVLVECGRISEAIHCFQKALEINPDSPDAYIHLGNAYMRQNKMEEAIHAYQKALEINPNNHVVQNSLGNALKGLGKSSDAVLCFQKALEIKPDYHLAYTNLGNVLKGQGKISEAIRCHKKALEIKPDYFLAYNNLGNALKEQAKAKEAIESYRKALEINPNYYEAYNNLLFALNYSADYDAAALLTEHIKYGQQLTQTLGEPCSDYSNIVDTERPLRIGYVSGDFRDHSVAYFIERILQNHTKPDFEIFCYSNHQQTDHVTQRLQGYTDLWIDISGLTDQEVEYKVRNDKIDILVDLSGQTAFNRLPVFASKPAPVQVTYLGYPGTTGLPAMDYRLTDGYADPMGRSEGWYLEKLIRLPDATWCYRGIEPTPEIASLPSETNGFITFGCFNSMIKITPQISTIWATILRSLPGSRLMLKSKGIGDEETQRIVKELFTKFGLEQERIIFQGWKETEMEHLEMYNQVDIALDTFPYHGTATTFEALWMGVPVVTLSGDVPAARPGVSILTTLGLDQLIAKTPEEYAAIALNLANNRTELTNLRKGLREQLKGSALMDGKKFARNLEDVYRKIWIKWCNSCSE